MNINLKTLLLGANLFFVPTISNAQCVATTDCASLGYTKTSCPNGKGLKCPFGSTWACIEDKIENTLSIGDFLYADKTTSPDIIPGKSPIGMVIDAKNRLAVALETQNLAWQTDTPNSTTGTTCNRDLLIDIPSLPNCTIGDYSHGDNLIKNMSCEADGKQNTAKIVSYAKEKNLLFPAAEYCYEYAPSGCTEEWCGKGQWFLPSMKQFNEFLKSFIIYTYQMKALKKPVKDFNEYYWTSNEWGNMYAYWCDFREKIDNYFVSPNCGYSGSYAPKCNVRKVVPFIEF